MPIASTDLKFRLSGGPSNASAAASLGGAISSTAAPATIFDDVSSDEAAAGRVEYRCIYILNGHASLTALGLKAWLAANTPSADTTIDIGLGTSALGGVEQTIANETAAPVGVTFSAAATESAALAIGDTPAGSWKATWLRRTVNANAAGPVTDTFMPRAKCDTLP